MTNEKAIRYLKVLGGEVIAVGELTAITMAISALEKLDFISVIIDTDELFDSDKYNKIIEVMKA